MNASPLDRPDAAALDALRKQISSPRNTSGPVLAFGLDLIDDRLIGGGLATAGLHEVAAASAGLCDDAAATLFVAGIAARFARHSGRSVLWTLTTFDLYAPGLAQVGLDSDTLLYGQGRKDGEALAMAEDGLRDGSLACVIAEVKAADRTATRRLQLAAADRATPMLLYRRHRSSVRCPLDVPSPAMTRWRIGTLPTARLPVAGVGRSRWSVELVRQRNGHPFSFELEACDDTGRLALPAPVRDRTAAPKRTDEQVGATERAA